MPIRSIPDDDAVLIFLHKAKPKLDMPGILKRDLEELGIDTEARTPNDRRRINIATWGQNTGTSRWKHCAHTIHVTTFRKPGCTSTNYPLASRKPSSRRANRPEPVTLRRSAVGQLV